MPQTVAGTVTRIGAYRACDLHGEAMSFRGVLEHDGHAAVQTIVEGAFRAGHLSESRAEHVATLDLLDESGDILQDYTIPTEAAWTWWLRAAELRLTESDCPVCGGSAAE